LIIIQKCGHGPALGYKAIGSGHGLHDCFFAMQTLLSNINDFFIGDSRLLALLPGPEHRGVTETFQKRRFSYSPSEQGMPLGPFCFESLLDALAGRLRHPVQARQDRL
jgi:hypothetical protein